MILFAEVRMKKFNQNFAQNFLGSSNKNPFIIKNFTNRVFYLFYGYLLLFSPFSYQVAIDWIIASFAICSQVELNSIFNVFYSSWYSKVGDSLHFSSQAICHQQLSQHCQLLAISHRPSLNERTFFCLLYTSPSPRDLSTSRMPSSA